MADDASVKVGVETKDAEQNLKRLGDRVDETGQKFTKFDAVVGAAFGSKNIFHVTNFNRAITYLKDTAETAALVLTTLNVAIAGLMTAVIKELNKLQGFLSVMALSTQSTAKAAEQFEFLRAAAGRLGIDINALLTNYAKLLAAIPDGNEKFMIAQKVFTGLAMAARTLHASTLDTQLMFYAVTQIASKGVLSMEELRRQLGERLPGAMEIAARSIGTTTQALEKAIRTGAVQSIPFLKFFGDELIRTFAGSAEIASNTVDAAFNRLKNVWIDFTKAVLDSGAGQAIIGVFDALREKLADPEIMRMFAETINRLSRAVTDFVKSLTAQDMLNAFHALETGISAVVTVTLKLLDAMTWIIQNSKVVGAVIGGLFGAAKGAAIGALFGGPSGALLGAGIGGAAGAIGGYAGGSLIAPSDEERYRRNLDQQRAADQALMDKKQRDLLITNVFTPLFKAGYSFSQRDVDALLPLIEKNLGITSEAANKFGAMLTDPKYKSIQEKQAAALQLASTGYVLGPRGTLEDVLGPSTTKPPKEKREPRMLTKKDDLAEGEKYIDMLERMSAKEEELTEVEKLWRALADDRVHFNSEENFLRAKKLAMMIDELKLTNDLVKSGSQMRNVQQDYIDQLNLEVEAIGKTAEERAKNQTLMRFDQQMYDIINRASPQLRDELTKLAALLRTDFAKSFDDATKILNSFETGLINAFTNWKDTVGNDAKTAADLFQVSISSMEDALTNFMTTGRFEWSKFVDSMIADLARLVARQGLLMAFQGLGSLFQGWGVTPSAGSTTGTGTTTPGIGLGGWTGRASVGSTTGSKSDNGKVTIVISPTINVDSRTDQAQIYQIVDQGMRASEARMYDQARRKVT